MLTNHRLHAGSGSLAFKEPFQLEAEVVTMITGVLAWQACCRWTQTVRHGEVSDKPFPRGNLMHPYMVLCFQTLPH
jgi:hypothetical protein